MIQTVDNTTITCTIPKLPAGDYDIAVDWVAPLKLLVIDEIVVLTDNVVVSSALVLDLLVSLPKSFPETATCSFGPTLKPTKGQFRAKKFSSNYDFIECPIPSQINEPAELRIHEIFVSAQISIRPLISFVYFPLDAYYLASLPKYLTYGSTLDFSALLSSMPDMSCDFSIIHKQTTIKENRCQFLPLAKFNE